MHAILAETARDTAKTKVPLESWEKDEPRESNYIVVRRSARLLPGKTWKTRDVNCGQTVGNFLIWLK